MQKYLTQIVSLLKQLLSYLKQLVSKKPSDPTPVPVVPTPVPVVPVEPSVIVPPVVTKPPVETPPPPVEVPPPVQRVDNYNKVTGDIFGSGNWRIAMSYPNIRYDYFITVAAGVGSRMCYGDFGVQSGEMLVSVDGTSVPFGEHYDFTPGPHTISVVSADIPSVQARGTGPAVVQFPLG